MGATSSVIQLYTEAAAWFRKYFDEEMYVSDFQSIDRDSDGHVTIKEVEAWVTQKAANDAKLGITTGWRTILSNPEIIRAAHDQAGKRRGREKIIDINHFRNFLVHLFAISTLWVHFRNADSWMEGNDIGNFSLNRDEFKLALRTMTASYAREDLTDDQINESFDVLDVNKSDSISFLEVCSYCCKFISHTEKRVVTTGGKAFIGKGGQLVANQAIKDELNEDRTKSLIAPLEEKHKDAMLALGSVLNKNIEIASIEEVRLSTGILIQDFMSIEGDEEDAAPAAIVEEQPQETKHSILDGEGQEVVAAAGMEGEEQGVLTAAQQE